MFSLTMLGSGSAGNCAVIETNQCRLLIDGGLSARQMAQRLENLGIDPESLDGIVLTHEHGDHVCGLQVFCRKFAVPIYCNPLTAESIECGDERKEWRFFRTGDEFAIKDIAVETFPVPHDAADPVGFVFHHGRASLGYVTDLGFVTKLALERLRTVQTLVIETNHDERMLQNDSRRPWPVKQRILSRHGHLSNTSAAAVVVSLLGRNLERVVLGHLSRECNTADVALATVQEKLLEAGEDGLELFCASQAEASPRFYVGRQVTPVLPGLDR